jgi:nicotinate-nucleotide pyrophosphorylase (carboxylating)
VDGGPRARAALVAREAMVAAGLPLIPHVLRAYGGPEGEVTFSWLGRVHDGEAVPAGETLAVLEAPAAQLLTAERVLLNFLQRLSGVATATRRHVEALGETTTRLLDTRKTTPGFRALEKYAVGQGGGWNHRLGLYDRIMLKDNHLALLQEEGRLSLAAAVEAARRRFPGVPVQVEVDQLGQIPEVLDAGADCLLLDNFSDTDLAEAVELARGRCLTEASGGIGLERLGRLGAFGLDFVSTGACVHHSTWCDMALDWC